MCHSKSSNKNNAYSRSPPAGDGKKSKFFFYFRFLAVSLHKRVTHDTLLCHMNYTFGGAYNRVVNRHILDLPSERKYSSQCD